MKPKSNRPASLLSHITTAMLVAGALHAASATAATFQFRQPVSGLMPPAATNCAVPWGGSLAVGATVTAYQAATAPYGSTCVTEVRTCASSGALSGSYTQAACTVDALRTVADFGAYRGWSDGSYASSCNAYRTATGGAVYAGATGSGTYRLAVGGNTLDAYCDMVSAGGGWTRVVQQYEATPVQGWTGGINGSSYVLTADQIPAHTQVAFGKGNLATSTDYVNWTYTTGEIAPVSVTGLASGTTYRVARTAFGYYNEHNPTTSALIPTCPAANGNWCNTLTLAPLSGGPVWAFAPLNDYATIYRGYAMDGIVTFMGTDAYAWTLWVR